MRRALRFCSLLMLNVLVAVVCTAILEAPIARLFHPRSIERILWKEIALSVVCAGVIGFFMWRTWRTSATKWTWIVPALWFGGRSVLAALASVRSSSSTAGNILFQFFGGRGLEAPSMSPWVPFFLFTVPLVRGIAYSAGAYLSSLLGPPTSGLVPASPRITPEGR